jgi:hypothetical protein
MTSYLFPSHIKPRVLGDYEAACFREAAERREFTDNLSPLIIVVWVKPTGETLLEGFRCKTDTDGDGDCHLCHRKTGGCPHVRR